MSLPLGRTRDGSNNTNNWAESAFLVFDKVFLDMRKNKRYVGCSLHQSVCIHPETTGSIDRLGAIILNEWFLYYEETEQNSAIILAQIQDDILHAYNLWDSNWIDPVQDWIYRVWFHK